jgi:hypothetical protein
MWPQQLLQRQMLPQLDGRVIRAEAPDEHALMLTSPADGNECHLQLDELAEGSTETSSACVAIAGGASCYRLAPGHFARSFGSRKIAAEAPLEFLGVRAPAEFGHIHVVVPIRVAARAQRRSFPVAEESGSSGNCGPSSGSRQGHLVGPLPIHHRLAEFAVAIGHWRLRGGRRPHSTRRPGEGQGQAQRSLRAALKPLAEVEQKRNKNLKDKTRERSRAPARHWGSVALSRETSSSIGSAQASRRILAAKMISGRKP